MPAVKRPLETLETRVPTPALLGVFTDYDTLVAPHVPAVRDVLTGKTHRYKVAFNDAVLVFHHGCLMVQVVHDGLIRALPPFGLTEDGRPYLSAMPEHQMAWMDEFLTLPKSILFFYFSLLKAVFHNQPLSCRWEAPVTGRTSQVPVPEVLQPILSDAGWSTL